jgi:hypothetical protein
MSDKHPGQTQDGGEKLSGGVPPTGDKPSKQAVELNEQLTKQAPAANVNDADFNPTTPDGSPPPNNLPGPHGPQGQEGQLVDPADL